MRTALNFLIIALVALVITVAGQAGAATLQVLLTALTIGFFMGIALFGYKLYRENSLTVDAMTVAQRASFYGSVAVVFLVFAATRRFFEFGWTGVAVWLGLLILSSFVAFLAYSRSRSLYT